MRIPKSMIPVLAKGIIEELLSKNEVELKSSKGNVTKLLEELLLEELTIEDRLNQEVREMLKRFDSEIEKGHLDYRKLFEMTKQKLIRERNIVL